MVHTDAASKGAGRVTEQYTTARRRKLATELRRLREGAGVSLGQAAEALDAATSKISRIENGRSGVRKVDLLALLDCYGIKDADVRTALVHLARESRQKGWWHDYGDALSPGLQDLVGMEAESARICEFQTLLVPALLQTEAYTRAVIDPLQAAGRPLGEAEIESQVAVRMQRQGILRADDAPQLLCVLDQAVISRPIGGAKVMRNQLTHLLEVSRPPHLTIQIIPFSAGRHVGLDGPFRIISHRDPVDLDVVSLGYLYGGLYLEEDAHVERYRLLFDHLRAQALSSAQSMDLISRAMRDLDS